MARTADLGWCVARLSVHDGGELLICSPASSDDAATSVTVVGWEGICALRDLIDEGVSDLSVAAELQSTKTDIETGG